MPKKKNQLPSVTSRKGISLKGLMNSMITRGFGRGLSLDLTVRLAIINMPSIVNAADRMAQGKPTSGISLVTMIGRTTPPKDEPEAMTPKAVARFLKNQVPTQAIAA